MSQILNKLRLLSAVVVFLISLSTSPASALVPAKDFGVVSDPWQIRNWSATIGASPTMNMEFEAWSRNRVLDSHFAQARLNGSNSFMVTWEPWAPVAASLGLKAQGAVQPIYSNAAIARGDHDAYIQAFAQSVAKSGLQTVYIRYAHEMNGNWYPWSNDSASYILAWRHIVNIFRANGATNAKFVYSTNPSLYLTDAAWTTGFWKYWPGGAYVDYVGSTMINFGSTNCTQTPCPDTSKGYSVNLFSQRIIMGYRLTGKLLVVTEFNTSLETSLGWLNDFNNWLLTGTSWIKAVVLSQNPSRGSQQMPTGNLSWNVTDYPTTYLVIRNIVHTATGN